MHDVRHTAGPSHRPAVGTQMLFRWRKWDSAPHWVHEIVYLGADEWGDWVGQPVGWRSSRPGREFVASTSNVTLVPPSGDFALTVNAAPNAVRVYIDLAWDVRWSASDPTVLEGIDMDLDVVRRTDGRGTWIDDIDEWDEHRVAYGYPPDIVDRLESRAAELEKAVRGGRTPFDDATADRWIARLDQLGLPPEPDRDSAHHA